jgi:hypothetical protein
VLDRYVVALDSTTAPAAQASVARPLLREPGRWGRLVLTVGVIVAALTYVWFQLSTAFYFHHDDLFQFSVSEEYGLSWELLGLNVFGHFAPFNRFLHLVLVREFRVSLEVGTAVMTALVAALLLSVLWLAVELRLPFWRRTFVLLLTGFSVAVLDTAVWLDGGVHILSALTVTYLVVAAHVRGLNTGRGAWHVLSVVMFALGFATQERTAFALPLIVLVDLLLVGAGRPWRRRLALLWSARWALAAMVVLSLTAVALLRAFYQGGDVPAPTLGEVGRVFAGATTSVLVPTIVGLPPADLPSAGVQFLAGVCIVAVAALLLRRDRRNAGPLAMVLATAVLYYGFLIFSPILTPETVVMNALRLNNVVYLLVPTLLALAHLDLRMAARAGSAPGPAVRARYVPLAAVVLTAVVLIGTSTVFVGRQWGPARLGHAYLQEVEDGRQTWSAPDVTLLPLRVPTAIAEGWAENYGRQAHFLKYYDRAWAPAPLGERPVVLDQLGRVRDVALLEAARAQLPFEGGRPGCIRSEEGRNFIPFSLSDQVSGAPLFAEVTYDLTAPGQTGVPTVVSSITEKGEDVPSWQAFLPAGAHTVVLPLQSDSVTGFIVGDLPVGVTLCATAASLVRPVYETDGQCVLVDPFGARGQATACPTDRRSG